jgi:hypothetical protein
MESADSVPAQPAELTVAIFSYSINIVVIIISFIRMSPLAIFAFQLTIRDISKGTWLMNSVLLAIQHE